MACGGVMVSFISYAELLSEQMLTIHRFLLHVLLFSNHRFTLPQTKETRRKATAVKYLKKFPLRNENTYIR